MRTAYCYRRPDRRDEFAFTIKCDGKNLPNAPLWQPYKSVRSIELGGKLCDPELNQLEREILKRLDADGFFITTTEKALPRVHLGDRNR